VNKKFRRILLWTLAISLMFGLLWAALDLNGQSNKTAADAGSNAADMDMASLDSIKPKATSKINWKQEKALRSKIDQADSQYRKILETANAEISSAQKVSDATRDSGMTSAKSFQDASEEYAAFWDKNDGKSRAKLAREAGLSRVKSAEMALNNISKDKIEAYNTQQDSLRKAQTEYMNEAKTDLSSADKASLKANLAPKIQKIAGNLATLMQGVTGLISQVKEQVSAGGISGAVGGCAKTVTSGGSASDGVSALISPLTSLLSLVKGMTGNVQGMLSDLGTLG